MNVAIVQVVYSHVEHETEQCIRRCCAELGMVRLPEVTGHSSLAEARTLATQQWLDWPRRADGALFDAFLSVDHDMVFTAEDVRRLVLRAGKYDVIGADYLDRQHDEPSWRPLRSQRVTIGGGGGPIPARVGMGLTLVTRRALMLAARTAPEREDGGGPHWFAQGPLGPGGAWLREDHAFCARVLAAGGAVAVDTSVTVGHIRKEAVYSTDKLRVVAPRPASVVVNFEVPEQAAPTPGFGVDRVQTATHDTTQEAAQ